MIKYMTIWTIETTYDVKKDITSTAHRVFDNWKENIWQQWALTPLCSLVVAAINI